jgi:hypothetical protein
MKHFKGRVFIFGYFLKTGLSKALYETCEKCPINKVPTKSIVARILHRLQLARWIIPQNWYYPQWINMYRFIQYIKFPYELKVCDVLYLILVLVSWGGVVRLHSLCTSANNWPLVPASDDNEYGAFGGMRIGKENLSTRRKPSTVPLCLLQVPHDFIWNRTRVKDVGNRQRNTARAMARQYFTFEHNR